MCDFHAHLADSEIIGLLGGYWDHENRTMFIQAPFPCLSTARDDDGATDVEMDPASDVVIREVIRSHGMQVLGWYHSHPKFQPDPSVTDMMNQMNYQRFFVDERVGVSPFLGLIVGTYDTSMASAQSICRYFHMDHASGLPKELAVTVRRFKHGLSDTQREGRRRSTLEELQRRHAQYHEYLSLHPPQQGGEGQCGSGDSPAPPATATAPGNASSDMLSQLEARSCAGGPDSHVVRVQPSLEVGQVSELSSARQAAETVPNQEPSLAAALSTAGPMALGASSLPPHPPLTPRQGAIIKSAAASLVDLPLVPPEAPVEAAGAATEMENDGDK